MFRKFFTFSNATLLVALTLSTIAAWYSIVGLTAIFAGAVIPIIIMGSALELGKIVTTVWLRKYWRRASWILKAYLVPAVFFLAVLTSMGIFGFLSKAHMDQGMVSGDVQAKLSLYDEKIKTQRDNIALARKALEQMDAQVDQRLARSDSEQAAERAVAIRRQQAGERTKLQKEIGDAQKEIAKLNEERAPIAAENRKVEAEVGPIKYIAALIYGDNPDQNILERAVRWVIILLVAVFDPLALMLVIAANQSREWDNEETEYKPDAWVADVGEKPTQQELTEDEEPVVEEQVDPHPIGWMYQKDEKEESLLSKYPYLTKPFKHFKKTKPMVYKPEIEVSEEAKVEPDLSVYDDERLVSNVDKQILAAGVDVVDRPGDYVIPPTFDEKKPPIMSGDYVEYDGKYMHKTVFAEEYPDVFLHDKNMHTMRVGFGTKFPEVVETGDTFVRIDVYPNRVYKYNGRKWLEKDKEESNLYLTTDYLQFLVGKIATGEYDPDLLTENEQEAIKEHIKKG